MYNILLILNVVFSILNFDTDCKVIDGVLQIEKNCECLDNVKDYQSVNLIIVYSKQCDFKNYLNKYDNLKEISFLSKEIKGDWDFLNGKTLESINIFETKLATIPTPILSQEKLEILSIYINDISNIDKKIESLNNLKTLRIKSKTLKNLEFDLDKLDRLEKLEFEYRKRDSSVKIRSKKLKKLILTGDLDEHMISSIFVESLEELQVKSFSNWKENFQLLSKFKNLKKLVIDYPSKNQIEFLKKNMKGIVVY